MNHSTRLPFANRRLLCSRAPLCALIVLLLGSTWFTTEAAALEAGFARADITPVLGTPLAGRLERWGRGSETIHDSLNARCLYLDDGKASIFLVSADLYAVSPELRSRVLELAPQVVPPERIVIAATHTHSGPGGMDRGLVRRVMSGRSSPRVLEETAQQIAGCMQDAYDTRRRAAVGHATALWTPPETLVDVNVQPAPTTVLRVEDSDGEPIAIVVTAPLMPDNVGIDELLTLSADFPGSVCKVIDDTLSDEAGALFFNGASGDFVRSKMQDTTSWIAIDSIGSSIGTLALALSDSIACGELPIDVRSTVQTMPLSLGDSWLPNDLLLTQCSIGDLAFTFVPLGVSAGVFESVAMPEEGKTSHVVVGYTNGFAGHVVPGSEFAADTAAARLHYFGPYMVDRLTSGVTGMLERGDDSEASTQAEPSTTNPVAEHVGGIYILNTMDTPGASRGSALSDLVRTSFTRRIHEPTAAGTLLPSSQVLAHVPWFVDASPVSLLHLAFETRSAWAALDANQQRHVKGFANGAGLPLEAAWLLQHEEALLGYAGNSPNAPWDDRTLMFAVHGDKAGAEGLIAGIRIPWVQLEAPMIRRGVSDSGMSFASLTPAHAMGSIAGMNDAGIVVCAVRNSERGRPRLALPPLPIQLERALGLAKSADALIAELASTASMDGFDLFVADMAAEKALVVRGSMEPESPSLARGLTAGRAIESGSTNSDRDDPRRLLVDFVKSERIVSADELASFVVDLSAAKPQGDLTEAFVSILFEPKAKKLRIRFENNSEATGDYVTVSLQANAS